MDAAILFLDLIGALLVLGLLALAWGVDSRDSMVDDHRR
jgi:hypothetical protein